MVLKQVEHDLNEAENQATVMLQITLRHGKPF